MHRGHRCAAARRAARQRKGARVAGDPARHAAARQRECAWAIGDCARIVNAHDGELSPPTGQLPSGRVARLPRTSSARCGRASPAVHCRRSACSVRLVGATRSRDSRPPNFRFRRLVPVAQRVSVRAAVVVTTREGRRRLGLGPAVYRDLVTLETVRPSACLALCYRPGTSCSARVSRH